MADNLLDKASILLTPTAYNDGSMLSVKPNENLYGSELVTNGDFATDSDWTKDSNWSIVNGVATSTGGGRMFQSIPFLETNIGTNVKVSFDITERISGGVKIDCYGAASQVFTDVGTHTFIGKTTNSLNLYINNSGQGNLVGSIDNVSVVEDLTGDFQFSRSSAATRVNAQGLVENVQIISDELVSNGNFSQIGTEEVLNGNFSQEGSEQISNGSFDTDTKWTTNTGWSISSGSANCDGTQSGNTTLVQQNGIKGAIIDFVVGKTYKVNFDIVVTSGVITQLEVASGVDGNDITTSGNYTTYITAVSTNDRFTITANSDFIGSIDNVSVKEVGQNWTFFGEAELTSQGARIYSSSGGQSYIVQSVAPLTTSKSYKFSYEITDSTQGSLKLINVNGLSDFPIPSTIGTHTVYFTADNSSFFVYRNSGVTDVTITNISVKEVGQDWTFGTDVVVGDSVVKMNNSAALQGATQTNVITSGNLCKVSFEVKNYVNGIVNLRHPLNENVSANGVYNFVGNANDTKVFIRGADTTNNFEITNISVKEITDDTDIPRINYSGFSYQDSLGSELVVNGDFSNGSANWTISGSNLSIANGKGISTGSNFGAQFKQTILQTNKTYKLTFDIVDYTSGAIGLTANYYGEQNIFSSIGTHTADFTSLNQTELRLYSENFIGSIDNVSVKEVTGQEVVPDSGCGSWLLEPQSTNLYLNSETLLTQSNATSASTYTVSFYGTGTITFSGTHTGTLVGTGANDRVSVTFTATSGTLTSTISGTCTKGQLENLSYATSYIPTSGATNTRLQDIATNSGNSSLINSTEGVLYAEISALSDDTSTKVISLSDSSSSNKIELFYFNGTTIYINVFSNGVSQGLLGSLENIEDFNKIAFKYKENDFALWVNGTEVATDTSASTPIGLSELAFDNGTGGNKFIGKVKALAVYKEALTDAELQSLTTI